MLVDDEGDDEELPPSVRRLVWPTQAEQVRWLREMVTRYRGNQLIRHKAIDIAKACPAKAKMCQAVAIARWVQTHIHYINEGVETFQSPVRTLTWRFGDCDDFTSLIATMIEAIGIPAQLVGLEWWKPEGGKMLRHIFPRAVASPAGGGLPRPIPLDATLNQDVRGLPNPIAISIRRGDNPRVLVL